MPSVAGDPAVRVLALHLTKPSNSEANVLAGILHHLPDDVSVDLVVNAAGDADQGSWFRSLAGDPRVRVHSLNVGLPIDPWYPPSRLRRLLGRSTHPLRRRQVEALARQLAPDVVYTSQQRFDCQLGERIAGRLGVPQVVHLHYTPGPWLRQPVLARLRSCAAVIAISRFIGEQAQAHGVPADRITVIPNTIAVGPEPRRAPDGADVVIGQVGRMEDGKGFEATVDVFARVHATVASTRLLLVGGGAGEAQIRERLRQRGVAEFADLVGWQADVRPWYERMHVVLNPSLGEPFGLVVLEAMAAGLPVVAYRDGGVKEIVVDGETGFLVAPGDVDGLVDRVLTLVGDASQRAAFGAAGRARAQHEFDPQGAGRDFGVVVRRVAAAPMPT